jgi:hypothetical protein
MMGYIGMIPLLFAIFSITNLKRSDPTSQGRTLRNIRNFYIGVILVSLALSLKTPVANILLWLKIPVLSSSSPARIIGIISFSLAVLSASGLDFFLERFKEKKQRGFYQASGIVATTLVGMWIWSLASTNTNASIAHHNLILPSIIFLVAIIGCVAIQKMGNKKEIIIVSCFLFLVSSFDLFRFHHKFTPFTDATYFYPTIPVIDFLEQRPGRVFGLFDANMNLPFRIQTIEGYDPLVLKDYVRYSSQAETGEMDVPIRTSAVQFPKNGKNTIRILNEIGVKYVVQPTIHGAAPWELHLWEYPGQFNLIYHDDQYEVYENQLAQKPIEPYVSLLPTQEKLFMIGIAISGITVLVMLIIVLRSRISLRETSELRTPRGNKYFLPPDVFSRHRLMAKKIVASKSILDVGGSLGELRKFLPHANITTADVANGADVMFDGKKLPIDDHSYETVVSVDTFEHIPDTERPLFVKELFRVAKKQVVIFAPYGSKEHSAAEKRLVDSYERQGKSVPSYLQEHVKFGLPKEKFLRFLRQEFHARTNLCGRLWFDRVNFIVHTFEVQNGKLNQFLYRGKFLWNLCMNLFVVPFLFLIPPARSSASRFIATITKT